MCFLENILFRHDQSKVICLFCITFSFKILVSERKYNLKSCESQNKNVLQFSDNVYNLSVMFYNEMFYQDFKSKNVCF